MTSKDDITRMARQAGFEIDCCSLEWHDRIERFAALVAAAELERIIAANAPEIERCNAYIKALEEAVAAEREACAKVCEEYETANDITATWLNIVADAIRARGNT